MQGILLDTNTSCEVRGQSSVVLVLKDKAQQSQGENLAQYIKGVCVWGEFPLMGNPARWFTEQGRFVWFAQLYLVNCSVSHPKFWGWFCPRIKGVQLSCVRGGFGGDFTVLWGWLAGSSWVSSVEARNSLSAVLGEVKKDDKGKKSWKCGWINVFGVTYPIMTPKLETKRMPDSETSVWQNHQVPKSKSRKRKWKHVIATAEWTGLLQTGG